MRHLHLEFVCSGFSLGLAIFFLGATLWQLLLINHGAEGVILPIWMSITLSFLVGGILLFHAFDGIRTEIHQPKRRRHHAR